MQPDEQYASDVLQRQIDFRDGHAVILGAGANTRHLLRRQESGPSGALRAILDDNPACRGQRIGGLEVCLPAEYPLEQVDRVLITSEAHGAVLTRRAIELFAPGVKIDYTYDRRSSLVGRIHGLGEAIGAADLTAGPDALWQAADGLRTVLEASLRDEPRWRYGPARQIREFQALRDGLARLITWRGCRFYNLGCGRYHPIGLSLLALLCGAERALASDLNPALDERRSAAATLDLIHALLVEPAAALGDAAPSRARLIEQIESWLDLPALGVGRLGGAIRSDRLAYDIESIYDCSLPDASCDVIVSRAVFEHLPDVPGALEVLRRIMTPGSVAMITIDFCDHRIYQSPAQYHHWSHLGDLGEPAYMDTNRLRFPDYPPLLNACGFKIESYVPGSREPVPPAEKARLAEPYRTMADDDLAVTSATAVVRKPG